MSEQEPISRICFLEVQISKEMTNKLFIWAKDLNRHLTRWYLNSKECIKKCSTQLSVGEMTKEGSSDSALHTQRSG